MLRNTTLLFPLGAILVSVFSWQLPDVLSGYVFAIVPLLGLVMFSMGLSLNFSDFKYVFVRPGLIIMGVSLQYLFMPLIAWLLSALFELPAPIAAGLILIGACPGGTASNIICYLARGNVALSITLTFISTLLAVMLTPLLTYLYVDASIDVPVLNMMKSLLLVIIIPVVSGLLLNHFLYKKLTVIKNYLPLVSMFSVILIIGIIVARNETILYQLGLLLFIAVVLHNFLGLLSGYWFTRMMTGDRQAAKTIAIEVGMQNSGLGIVLANQYFTAAAALPGVLFSIWHNISGSLLAGYWARGNQYK